MQAVTRLIEIMKRLRHPETGCPWDREQTLLSILPFTLEEAYELADAVERGDTASVLEELGDLLFHIVFYARIAEESGAFKFGDVAAAAADKLETRHPHVFGGGSPLSGSAEQAAAWERQKTEE
ncbi:MAG: MazG nucleotide pyrophosphohydrolase domain-containing protein, partial [Gammaproteobacteria bacterium]